MILSDVRKRALELNLEGIQLGQRGLFGQAIVRFNEAISLCPDYVDAYNNLGKTYNEAGEFEHSLEACRQMLKLVPGSATVYQNMAKTYGEMAEHREAVSFYYKALALDQNSVSAYDGLLLTLNYTFISREAMYLEHAKFGRFETPHLAPPFHPPHRLEDSPPLLEQERKPSLIRLGYVSADFKEHPIGYIMKPILEHHDRSQFKIFLYNNADSPDRVSLEFKKAAESRGDIWRDITHLSDADAAKRISEDKIDILVDLSGHTGGNRLPVFALKPAPIQVTWLGYMNTTGLRAVDYRITDHFLSPVEEKSDVYYTEKLIRVKDSFTFLPLTEPPPIKSLPALKNGYITFGSLNNFKKINDQVLNLWADVLKMVPNSKLIISAKGDEAFHQSIRDRFVMRGIDGSRIELVGIVPMEDFLGLFDRVDIALDPFPFTGCITIYHGLYAGVPSVVLKGASEYERNGSAVLTKVGLTDWIAETPEQYKNIIVEKISNLSALSELRKNMRNRFNKDEALEVTKSIEKAFQQMIFDLTPP